MKMMALFEFISAHPEYALWMGFAMTFLQSTPVIGHFIPGFVVIPPFGWLVAKHILPPVTTISVLCIGGFLGDLCVFLLGRFGQTKLISKQDDSMQSIDKIKKWITEYGVYAVMIGRFSGPIRSLAPIAYGLFNMPLLHFTLACIPAIFLWTLIRLLPGYLVAYFQLAFSSTATFAADLSSIIILTATAGILLMEKPILRNIQKIQFINHHLPRNGGTYLLRFLLAFLSFLNLIFNMYQGHFKWVNDAVYHYLVSHHPYGLSVSLVFTALGDVTGLSLLSISVIILLMWSRCLALVSYQTAAFVFCFAGSSAIKLLLHYPRPEYISTLLSAYAFPSGHTAMISMLSYSIIGYHTSSNKRGYVFANCLIFLVALSRLYLGAHWLSDVVGGWLIGCMSLYFAELTRNFFFPKHVAISTGLWRKTLSLLCLYLLISIIFAWSAGFLNPDPYQYKANL